jgi:hypothetical protein
MCTIFNENIQLLGRCQICFLAGYWVRMTRHTADVNCTNTASRTTVRREQSANGQLVWKHDSFFLSHTDCLRLELNSRMECHCAKSYTNCADQKWGERTGVTDLQPSNCSSHCTYERPVFLNKEAILHIKYNAFIIHFIQIKARPWQATFISIMSTVTVCKNFFPFN